MRKKTLFTALLCLFAISMVAQNKRAIDNPKVEVRKSPIDHITRIELSDEDTRLHVRTAFIHNWWIKFDSNTFIRPTNTNKKLIATGIENGEFDKEIFMPESNDSSFVIIFPPLDKNVKKIDFGEGDDLSLFGISLTESQPKEIAKREVPTNVQKWLDDEVNKSKRKSVTDFNSDDFFQHGISRLVGYIKGYDPRLGFSTGIVYASNELTRESSPIVIKIHEDGRFEADIPLQYPSVVFLSIQKAAINIYFEPNTTQSMVLDWDEFLYADRWRNTRHSFKNIVFGGATAQVNRDLLEFALKEYEWKEYDHDKSNLSPSDYKTKVTSWFEDNKKIIAQAKQSKSLPQQSLRIIENTALLSYAERLLDYTMMRDYYAQEDDANDMLKIPLPDDYYDFLNNIPWGDQSLITPTSFSSFINRFEFNSVFSDASKKMYESLQTNPDVTFNQYLEDSGVIFSEEDIEMIALQDSMLNDNLSQEERMDIYVSNESKFAAFNEKYSDKMVSYIEKYIPLAQKDKSYELRNSIRDSIMINKFNIEPDLLYHITKTRALKFELEHSTKEEATNIINSYENNVSHPFLISEGRRLFDEAFPDIEKRSFVLPEGEPTDIFKKITDKFRGKYVLVDFWDIYCGPCISSIEGSKQSRNKHKDSNDIVFVFITSESGSPLDRYNPFVEEQAMEHSYRLTDDEFKYMRQLFQFNGIPHYRTLDREGNVLHKGIEPYNFEHGLKRLLDSEK